MAHLKTKQNISEMKSHFQMQMIISHKIPDHSFLSVSDQFLNFLLANLNLCSSQPPNTQTYNGQCQALIPLMIGSNSTKNFTLA